MTKICEDLVQAYRLTRYRVQDPAESFTLTVDKPSVALAALYVRDGVISAAFLTAWNPQSRSTSAAENDARHDALVHRVRAAGSKFLEGSGEDPKGQWPAERSLLVLGADLGATTALAREFDQNAFIWCGEDAVPRLIQMRLNNTVSRGGFHPTCRPRHSPKRLNRNQ